MAARTKTKTADTPTLIIDNGATAVPAVQKNAPPPALVQADPLLSLIERASKDPAVDIDKMERLIAMHDRVKAGNAQADYDVAMAVAQSEMKTIKTNKSNNHTHSKYATYEAMDKAIRPIYTKHGFAMSFNTGDSPRAEEVRVLCTISHRGGHRQEYKMDVPADGKGPKGDNVLTKTHAASSAVSYGKRILASMAWNLSVGDDDDGNSAASIAERAKTMADTGIEYLNTANLDKGALEKYRTKQDKNIKWLKENAPKEFERFQTAYSNAAEAAGIKKEEPRRATKKAATDVVDENQKPAVDPDVITFETYKTLKDFYDFSDTFLQSKATTSAMARQWEEFYRAKIKELAESPMEARRQEIAETIGLYSAKLAEEQEG